MKTSYKVSPPDGTASPTIPRHRHRMRPGAVAPFALARSSILLRIPVIALRALFAWPAACRPVPRSMSHENGRECCDSTWTTFFSNSRTLTLRCNKTVLFFRGFVSLKLYLVKITWPTLRRKQPLPRRNGRSAWMLRCRSFLSLFKAPRTHTAPCGQQYAGVSVVCLEQVMGFIES
jgi:hypothetical protein